MLHLPVVLPGNNMSTRNQTASIRQPDVNRPPSKIGKTALFTATPLITVYTTMGINIEKNPSKKTFKR